MFCCLLSPCHLIIGRHFKKHSIRAKEQQQQHPQLLHIIIRIYYTLLFSEYQASLIHEPVVDTRTRFSMYTHSAKCKKHRSYERCFYAAMVQFIHFPQSCQKGRCRRFHGWPHPACNRQTAGRTWSHFPLGNQPPA